jgi:hypothetical protein
MNALDTKINYFRSKLDAVKRAKAHLDKENADFNREFSEFLKKNGVPETFSPLDLIETFRKKPGGIITLD